MVKIGKDVKERLMFQPTRFYVKRIIRPIAIGRKNHLFVVNDRGAEANCIYYTFIANCKELAVGTLEWYNKVFTLISDDIPEVELIKQDGLYGTLTHNFIFKYPYSICFSGFAISLFCLIYYYQI